MSIPKTNVLVAGQPVIDILTMQSEAFGPADAKNNATPFVSYAWGGPALIAKLLEATVPDEAIVMTYPIPRQDALTDRASTEYALVRTNWKRIIDPGSARNSAAVIRYVGEREVQFPSPSSSLPEASPRKASLLILDGTRCQIPELPDDVYEKASSVLLKLSQLAESLPKDATGLDIGKLPGLSGWKKFCDKTTLFLHVDDLRVLGGEIGKSLSWEQMFEKVAAKALACASRAARVVVSIDLCGAVIVTSKTHEKTLVFDRKGQEGDFRNAARGTVLGYTSCLLAGAAAEILQNHSPRGHPQPIDWIKAVRKGLLMARCLHHTGYRIATHAGRLRLAFPFKEIAQQSYDLKGGELGEISFSGKKPFQERWSILNVALMRKSRDFVHIAKAIVTEGPDNAFARDPVPIETIKKWRSADRDEIEGVRCVKNIMRVYLDKFQTHKRPEKPLSIAVFGKPGGGKSFAVKQIAKELGFEDESMREFNLSQFETPSDLVNAFHEMRDVHLRGRTPLVFWDEFDSSLKSSSGSEGQLGWLRYFLAPMQDGYFLDRGNRHPVGGGIFIFAGGVYETFQSFCGGAPGPMGAARNQRSPTGENKTEKPERLKALKVPDFISRLRGYINVKSLNQQGLGKVDAVYVIRRALVLHSILEMDYPSLRTDNGGYRVDEPVLDYLLVDAPLLNEARSLHAILESSSIPARGKFAAWNLPPENLRKMHQKSDLP